MNKKTKNSWLCHTFEVSVLHDEGVKPRKWIVKATTEYDAMQLAFALDGGWGQIRDVLEMLELSRAYCSIKSQDGRRLVNSLDA